MVSCDFYYGRKHKWRMKETQWAAVFYSILDKFHPSTPRHYPLTTNNFRFLISKTCFVFLLHWVGGGSQFKPNLQWNNGTGTTNIPLVRQIKNANDKNSQVDKIISWFGFPPKTWNNERQKGSRYFVFFSDLDKFHPFPPPPTKIPKTCFVPV